jgi:proteasome lid subunit RPN8/RPN11
LTLEISAKHVERISSHSKESYPVEACGVLIGTLAGDVRTVTEVWPAKNQLSSESSYEIDPETLFGAFSHAEQNNVEVVGFYHSHPFWSADASAIDKARANYPGLSYLIYSIPRNEILSFYFDGRRLVREPVRMTSD